MHLNRLIVCMMIVGSFSVLHGQGRVTLRLVDWADLDEMPSDVQALEAFRKVYPNIDVLYEPNPGRVYEEKILTGLAADEPPDVFLLDSKLVPTFTNKKVLLDLAPYIASLGIDTLQWYTTVLNLARKGSSLYAFPKGFTPLVVYYNKRLFDEARLSYPSSDWNWNDYLSVSQKLTKDVDGDGAPDQYGTTFTNYYFYWIPWVWSAGGDVVDKDGAQASGILDSPQTENALQFLIDLRKKFNVAPEVGSWVQAEKTGTNYALFANGKVGMIIDGHWRMPKYLKYMGEGILDIGVAPLPRHPEHGKVNVMYESGWCVPINTKHPEESVLLASFMAGETACRIRAKNRLEIPANIAVTDELVRNDSTGMEKVFVDELSSCRQPWGSIIERFSEIEWTLQDAVDEVMINGKPIRETMARYAGKVDKELRNIRQTATTEFKPIREHSGVLYFMVCVTVFVLCACAVLYWRARGRERTTLFTAFGFLGPSLIHLVVFIFTPILFAAYLSVHRWDIVVPNQTFVGAGNFVEMSSDANFWNALKNTFLFSLNVPVGMAVALAVALMMHKKLRGVGVLRTLYFLPSVSSFVAIALVWMWIYHPSFGAANYILSLVGLPPLQWLNATQTAMISVIIFTVWMGLGYQMVIFLAGLQSIPEELYEAARIDGASRWQRFRLVTLPLLKPTTFFILVTSLIGSFQAFTSIYVMTAGGPVRSTDVIVYHIYQTAWEQLRMGYASALSWVLFLIIMIATWIQFKFMGKEIEY